MKIKSYIIQAWPDRGDDVSLQYGRGLFSVFPICVGVKILYGHLNKLLKTDKLSSRNIAKLTATINQSEHVKEEPTKSSNKRSFNMNSSTNQNSENEQSPAKVSKVQEIGKMLLIRPSSNQNRQHRVINQKTNSPPNTEVSSSSDRPEVISGKIHNHFLKSVFEKSTDSRNHPFEKSTYSGNHHF